MNTSGLTNLASSLANSSMFLTTESFFKSVNYMKNDAKLADIKNNIPVDPISGGVESIFNHFAVFRYVENFTVDKYEPDAHFVGYQLRHNFGADRAALNAAADRAEQAILNSSAPEISRLPVGDRQALASAAVSDRTRVSDRNLIRQEAMAKYVNNPTADRIIDWSKNISRHTNIGYQPYAWTDFAYCKYYGKIPNNRLITLRRYPFPIHDHLKGPDLSALIPMAQAVTWFGGETDNKLSAIGNWQWDMPWEKLTVTEQQVEGNEVLISDITSVLSGVGGKFGTALAKSLELIMNTANIGTNPKKAAEISGMDKDIQTYIKGLYNKDAGPYWNRIYGPVNVVHESSRRMRGIQTSWQTNFTLKFHYQFRSFSGMSPKMAALDLMSNFMALTFNDAQFLGQLARYFPKTGVKFDPTTTQVLTDLLMGWGMGKLSTKDAVNKISAIIKAQGQLFKTLKEEVTKNPASVAGDAVNAFALSKFKDAMPKLISVKSALADRPVGEWHIVVGNPMNPIFVMGDLICTKTTAKFDEEIGPDDFPTGITFDVTLQQAKPRDKTAIERMLNQGIGSLTATRLNPPTSANDTFGTENNDLYKKIYGSGADLNSQGDPSFKRYKDRVNLAYGISTASDSGVKVANKKNSISEFNSDVDSLLTTYFRKSIPKA